KVLCIHPTPYPPAPSSAHHPLGVYECLVMSSRTNQSQPHETALPCSALILRQPRSPTYDLAFESPRAPPALIAPSTIEAALHQHPSPQPSQPRRTLVHSGTTPFPHTHHLIHHLLANLEFPFPGLVSR